MPTTTQDAIQQKLTSALAPSELKVINESHQHNVPDGSESHFRLLVVSDEFTGLRQIQRQQRIYQLLSDEMAGSVHALTMQTLTPQEWETDQRLQSSPQCMGGSKADQ